MWNSIALANAGRSVDTHYITKMEKYSWNHGVWMDMRDVQLSAVVKHLLEGTDSAIAENLCAPPCKLPRENETDTGSTLPYSDALGTCKHNLELHISSMIKLMETAKKKLFIQKLNEIFTTKSTHKMHSEAITNNTFSN